MHQPLRLAMPLIIAAVAMLGPSIAGTAAARDLDDAVRATISSCYANNEGCKETGDRSSGMLVFPEVAKGGLIIGGTGGKGALVVDGEIVDHYDVGSASIGLLAGYKDFSLIIMFPSPTFLHQFRANSGWDFNPNFSVVAGESSANMDKVTAAELGMIDGVPVTVFISDTAGVMLDLSWSLGKFSKVSGTE